MRNFLIVVFIGLISCNNGTATNSENKNKINSLLLVANKDVESGQHKSAVDKFSQVLKLDSTIGEAYFKRAYAYTGLHDFKAAAKDYEKAEKLEYNLPLTYYNLGIIYYTIELNNEKAYMYFKKAYQLTPTEDNKALMLQAQEALQK